MTTSTRWSDLLTRIISAGALLLIATGAAMYGRLGFGIFVAGVAGAMGWELARMHSPRAPAVSIIVGVVTAALVIGQGLMIGILGVLATLLLSLILACGLSLLVSRDHPIFAAYWLAVLITGHLILFLFQPALVHLLLLMIAVVIVTDVFGYFAGRIIGGPKFWPQISPKKTWSGVIAGWFGAGLIGIGAAIFTQATIALTFVAVVMSMSAQLGDVAESAIKRRAGVKDSSDLIPGHGGFLDRFDGLIGAALVMFVVLVVDAAT